MRPWRTEASPEYTESVRGRLAERVAQMAAVLVVDDSAVDRRVIGELLARRPEYLIMPHLDGLQLVEAMRQRWPTVPVILTTAHGSELLAVRALKVGAAGYVPKLHLAEMLLATVEEVLALAHADREYEKMIHRLNRPSFSFCLELENDLAAIEPVVELVKHSIGCLRLCDVPGRLQVGVALREALRNAILRGNLEFALEEVPSGRAHQEDLIRPRRSDPRYRDRRVLVDGKISREEARFVVRDDGSGFNVRALPDPLKTTAGEQPGRGLSLMQTFMDEVRFNEAGNEVTLVRRRAE